MATDNTTPITPVNEQTQHMREGAKQATALWNAAMSKMSYWYIIGFLTALVTLLKKREGNVMAHYVLDAVRKSVEND